MIQIDKMTEDVNIHQSLPDKPTLSSNDLKIKWDLGVTRIKNYINDILIPSVEKFSTEVEKKIRDFSTSLEEYINEVITNFKNEINNKINEIETNVRNIMSSKMDKGAGNLAYTTVTYYNEWTGGSNLGIDRDFTGPGSGFYPIAINTTDTKTYGAYIKGAANNKLTAHIEIFGPSVTNYQFRVTWLKVL